MLTFTIVRFTGLGQRFGLLYVSIIQFIVDSYGLLICIPVGLLLSLIMKTVMKS